MASRAPDGWNATHQHNVAAKDLGYEPLSDGEEEVEINARKLSWAWLLAKVYEFGPLVCTKCGAGMKLERKGSDLLYWRSYPTRSHFEHGS